MKTFIYYYYVVNNSILNMSINIQKFLDLYCKEEEKIIIACSTGADSMFLLYSALNTSYRNQIVACYFNHNTRVQCKEEEQFLLDLGTKEGFQVEIGECDFEKIKKLYPSKSFEELAREKRYQFFDAVCHLYNSSKVITAHHLDDRIETYIFNMLRGSKLTGLINMKESLGGVLRPLLGIDKNNILKYLQENKLKYFEDVSNEKNDYTRNFIRNEILPKFSKVHPEHKKNLQNLFLYFEDLQSHLQGEVDNFLEKKENFSINAFNNLSVLLQKEVIREVYYRSNGGSTIGLSQGNIDEVIRFINGKNNKTIKNIRNMHLSKEGDMILIA